MGDGGKPKGKAPYTAGGNKVIPHTDRMPLRPVEHRRLMRKHSMPLEPPNEDEIADARRVLSYNYAAQIVRPGQWRELVAEAQTILDEAIIDQ